MIKEPGTKNFAQLMSELGEEGSAKFGQVLGAMTSTEVANLARAINPMSPASITGLATSSRRCLWKAFYLASAIRRANHQSQAVASYWSDFCCPPQLRPSV